MSAYSAFNMENPGLASHSAASHSSLFTQRFYRATTELTALIEALTHTDLNRPIRELSYFNSITINDQERVTISLENILEASKELIHENESPMNSKLLVIRFMQKMGLLALSDIFLTYKDGDLIDIYNSENKMIFSSLNLFATSSYSVEELFCRNWVDLWSRDEQITRQLLSKAIEVLCSDEKKTIYMSVPVHQVMEIASIKKNAGWVHCKIFSPIMSNEGRIAGFLCINELRSKVWSN